MSASLAWLVVTVLLALTIQLSRFNQPPPFNLYLTWTLVVVVCWSVCFGRRSGVLCGVVAGALLDRVTDPTALHWLCYATVGYVTGSIRLVLLQRNYGFVAPMVFISTFLCELAQAARLTLQQHPWAWPDFTAFILPLSLENTLIALPVFLLLQYLAPRIRPAGS